MNKIKGLEHKHSLPNDERFKRLAKRLRANLQRRKTQSLFAHQQNALTTKKDKIKEK